MATQIQLQGVTISTNVVVDICNAFALKLIYVMLLRVTNQRNLKIKKGKSQYYFIMCELLQNFVSNPHPCIAIFTIKLHLCVFLAFDVSIYAILCSGYIFPTYVVNFTICHISCRIWMHSWTWFLWQGPHDTLKRSTSKSTKGYTYLWLANLSNR